MKSFSTRKKVVIVKVLAVFLAFLIGITLAGCNKDAAPLREGFLKNLEIESSRSITTFSVANNVRKDELSEEALAVFALLDRGFSLNVDMASLSSMSMVIAPNNEDILRLMGFWPYPQDISAEFYMDGGRMAVKTSADPLYLVLNPSDAMQSMPETGVDIANMFGADYTESQIERVMEFMIPFIRDYNFSLSRVEELGSIMLELPDGTIEAEGYKIQIDFEELLAIVTYTLEYMAKSEALEDYLILSMQEPMQKMIESGAIPQEELPTVEEIDEMTDLLYQEFQTGILQAVDYLKNVSPALLQMQYGLELSASEEYYLDEAGYIRETRSTYNIKAEHEMLETVLGTSKLDLTISSIQTVWDINEPVEVVFPAAEEQISLFTLMEDPSQATELGEGPLSLLAHMLAGFSAVEQSRSLVVDLAAGIVYLDGQPVNLETEPYLEGEVIMVPFRDLAEIAAGEIHWLSDTEEVYYWDARVEMKISPGSRQAIVNGEKVELSEPVDLINGRVMVPAELGSKLAQHFFVQEGSNAVFIF